jgi:hypothetical protein
MGPVQNRTRWRQRPDATSVPSAPMGCRGLTGPLWQSGGPARSHSRQSITSAGNRLARPRCAGRRRDLARIQLDRNLPIRPAGEFVEVRRDGPGSRHGGRLSRRVDRGQGRPPSFTPRSSAAASPARVRSLIISRSCSATAARMCSVSRLPAGSRSRQNRPCRPSRRR